MNLRDLPRQSLIVLVRGYRLLLSPWLGSSCRFEPTCSAYALEALQRHGAARGAALTGWRLLRCHPWCQGGHDPVPTDADRAGAGLFTGLLRRPAADQGMQAASSDRPDLRKTSQ